MRHMASAVHHVRVREMAGKRTMPKIVPNTSSGSESASRTAFGACTDVCLLENAFTPLAATLFAGAAALPLGTATVTSPARQPGGSIQERNFRAIANGRADCR